MEQLCVLLYSKYSPNSKKFITMLQEAPIDFSSIVGMNTLCIDNTIIRKQVMRSKDIQIEVVPCILLVYSDGGVEKYDGPHAFNWAEEVIKTNSSNKSQPPLPIQPQSRQKTGDIQQSPPKQIGPSRTSIEDLVSDEEDQGEVEAEPSALGRPPRSIRSDAGNYELEGEFGEVEEVNRQVTRGVKSSALEQPGQKGGDLMSIALEMQKNREKADSTVKEVGGRRQQ